ncbi:6-cysteine protein,secreted ookinete protein [Plasmodium gonderi]|uniref:6-cysteine protein,secreted ookinete protein n=1 Tax=Plasmodium gonderi TaxID=77519 RepID=A0A1Y1JFX6_PLAGO|nr:6-cysteine protein,secreted ookinete protein [Plasmodium gonderi]GAW81419.1 6-cysteine protein,secreted ookinete protein [Plasmodium gonderi]
MTPIMKLVGFFLWMSITLKRVKGFYFTVQNELISKNTNMRVCHLEHFVNFKNEIVHVCLDKVETTSMKKHNIIISSYGEDKKWKERSKALTSYTTKLLAYFYTFTNNNQLVVVFCFNKTFSKSPYECFRTITDDLNTVKTEKIQIDLRMFEPSSFSDYALNSFDIFGIPHLLICGVNNKRNSGKNFGLFVICHASPDGGFSWGRRLHFYHPNMEKHTVYEKLVPKVSGNEIGFQYLSPKISLTKYLKCTYRKDYQFECHDVNLVREQSYMWDIAKVKGYYVAPLSDGKSPPCTLYYMYNDTYMIPLETPRSIGSEYHRGKLFHLDSERLIYNYENEKETYTYILQHKGTAKFCTLMYIKKDYMNAGFVKKGNNYYCDIKYDELVVDGEDRYFTVSIYNGVRQDIRKCFYLRYDKMLEPVNIVHKIDSVYEYSNFKLYTLYIKKDIEKYFLKDMTLDCYLGEDFYLSLHINFKNNFILDNTDVNQSDVNLYPNNIIYFKLPDARSQTLVAKLPFPQNTRYIKVDDYYYIFKLSSFIPQQTTTEMLFLNNKGSQKTQNKSVTFHAGGEQETILGVDFSRKNKICAYAGNEHNCDKIQVNGNKINVKVDLLNTQPSKGITLGIICPVNKKNKNTCFNEIYDNKKKIFIRDYLKDSKGFLTIYPKTYVHTPSDTDEIYEESILVLTPQFIDMYNANWENYKSTFNCKCYSDNMVYELTFNFTQG